LRDPVRKRALADLGPTLVWPKFQPLAAQWLERLDVATFEQFNESATVIVGYGPAPRRQPSCADQQRGNRREDESVPT